MTFTPIRRPTPLQPEPFATTPGGSIRLASHLTRSGGSSPLLIFWLSLEVAEAIGLVEKREAVSLLVDNSCAILRVAIQRNPHGDFRAARRSNAYSVHTDTITAGRLLGEDGYVWDIVGHEHLSFSPNMVVFPLPVRPITRRGA